MFARPLSSNADYPVAPTPAVQRATVTCTNPATGQRGKASVVEPRAFEEWLRRKEGGDEEEEEPAYPGDEMERGFGGGGGGSEQGDE